MTIRQHFKSNVSNVKLTSTDIACEKARRQDLREHPVNCYGHVERRRRRTGSGWLQQPSWSSVSSRQNEDCLSLQAACTCTLSSPWGFVVQPSRSCDGRRSYEFLIHLVALQLDALYLGYSFPLFDQVFIDFWLKYLTSMHKQLLEAFNEILKEPHDMPSWMTEGTAYLLPKSTETRNPKNYRPITCLPTTYKILTAILSNRIYNHLQENKILPEEQKGCRKGSRGARTVYWLAKW